MEGFTEMFTQDLADVLTLRGKSYGSPEESFVKIAKGWQVLLGFPVSPRDVARCMAFLKLARDTETPNYDNMLDAAGYAAIATRVSDEAGEGETDGKEVVQTDNVGSVSEGITGKVHHLGIPNFDWETQEVGKAQTLKLLQDCIEKVEHGSVEGAIVFLSVDPRSPYGKTLRCGAGNTNVPSVYVALSMMQSLLLEQAS